MSMDGLNGRQQEQYIAFETIAEKWGKWDASTGPDGAHYAPARANPFIAEGLICANCSFYEENGQCEIVQGPLQNGAVEPNAVCKLWIIPETPGQDGQDAMAQGILDMLGG